MKVEADRFAGCSALAGGEREFGRCDGAGDMCGHVEIFSVGVCMLLVHTLFSYFKEFDDALLLDRAPAKGSDSSDLEEVRSRVRKLYKHT